MIPRTHRAAPGRKSRGFRGFSESVSRRESSTEWGCTLTVLTRRAHRAHRVTPDRKGGF